ncbi:MAG: hypothetical protein QXU20_02095 [Candidatus Woesearchaeota archaeon]
MIKHYDMNDKEESYKDFLNENQFKLARTTYLILLGIILFLFSFHLFKIYDFRIDKFSYFITILLFLILIIPLVTYFKAFGLVEVRKDTRVMEKKKINKK